ncbi:nitrate reductase cytochrome c-type subunit [Minwuia thermotolerans]|nr:nitrate reductase cytochrome c-type subunit [Minwuia thermotolerans]
MPKRLAMITAALLALAAAPLLAQDIRTDVDPAAALKGLRGPAALSQHNEAPTMTQLEDGAERRVRNYPEQPPTIPHDIDGYQVDLNANKCLSCHARTRTGESGAPMVSVTHFMDRDGQFLAAVSPRRYFCTQCHVPQHRVAEEVGNSFVDIDSLIAPRADRQ